MISLYDVQKGILELAKHLEKFSGVIHPTSPKERVEQLVDIEYKLFSLRLHVLSLDDMGLPVGVKFKDNSILELVQRLAEIHRNIEKVRLSHDFAYGGNIANTIRRSGYIPLREFYGSVNSTEKIAMWYLSKTEERQTPYYEYLAELVQALEDARQCGPMRVSEPDEARAPSGLGTCALEFGNGAALFALMTLPTVLLYGKVHNDDIIELIQLKKEFLRGSNFDRVFEQFPII